MTEESHTAASDTATIADTPRTYPTPDGQPVQAHARAEQHRLPNDPRTRTYRARRDDPVREAILASPRLDPHGRDLLLSMYDFEVTRNARSRVRSRAVLAELDKRREAVAEQLARLEGR